MLQFYDPERDNPIDGIYLTAQLLALLCNLIDRACRRIQSEVIRASDLSFPLLFFLRFGSDAFLCPDILLGQFHHIPHEFVQIE